MMKNGMPDIKTLQFGDKLSERVMEHCRKLIPSFNGGINTTLLQQRIREELEFPCSMIVNNLEELAIPISTVYQVSHANYVLSKQGIQGFPSWMCHIGAQNVFDALLQLGYVNVTRGTISLTTSVHNYVFLPFVLTQDGKQKRGLIGVDPTSNLVSNNRREGSIKNLVFVVIGKNLKYVSPSIRYFPDIVRYPSITRTNGKISITTTSDKKVSEYFEKAFSNPVRIY